MHIARPATMRPSQLGIVVLRVGLHQLGPRSTFLMPQCSKLFNKCVMKLCRQDSPPKTKAVDFAFVRLFTNGRVFFLILCIRRKCKTVFFQEDEEQERK